MGPPKTSKRLTPDAWVLGAIELLAETGVKGVRVETLARRLGVTKGSFYWHFANRGALLEELLARWEALGTERLIQEIRASEQTPREALAMLWRLATEDSLDAELAIREWGRLDRDVSQRVAKVDERRIGFVSDLFVASGMPQPIARARGFQFYALLIGEHFIQLPLTDDDRAALVDAAVAGLLPPSTVDDGGR